MKIISEGNKKGKNRDIKFFCKNCGCVFVAEYGEYEITHTQIEGTWYDSKCPCCGKTVETQDPIFC